jgi:hypothetical protein
MADVNIGHYKGSPWRIGVARMGNVGRIEVSSPVKSYEFPCKGDR